MTTETTTTPNRAGQTDADLPANKKPACGSVVAGAYETGKYRALSWY